MLSIVEQFFALWKMLSRGGSRTAPTLFVQEGAQTQFPHPLVAMAVPFVPLMSFTAATASVFHSALMLDSPTMMFDSSTVVMLSKFMMFMKSGRNTVMAVVTIRVILITIVIVIIRIPVVTVCGTTCHQ